ncbi:MAG: NADH-quinone oxidoreductase subunit C [Actinomycetota bacterium]|nr:NADH-quinone oxidoreductase subunit C [Actinomycetota bacterium]
MSDDETPRENDHEAEPPDDEVAAALLDAFGGSIYDISHGQPVVYVDRAVFADVAMFLRDEQAFSMLIDVTAVDHLLDGVRYTPGGRRQRSRTTGSEGEDTGDGRRSVESTHGGAVALERFQVVANYLSHTRNRRIRVICEVPADDPTVPSVTPVYPGANFAEREVFDMFGISFAGHPELIRILMPDDWDGHPLRKDYPAARVPVTFKGDPSPR